MTTRCGWTPDGNGVDGEGYWEDDDYEPLTEEEWRKLHEDLWADTGGEG